MITGLLVCAVGLCPAVYGQGHGHHGSSGGDRSAWGSHGFSGRGMTRSGNQGNGSGFAPIVRREMPVYRQSMHGMRGNVPVDSNEDDSRRMFPSGRVPDSGGAPRFFTPGSQSPGFSHEQSPYRNNGKNSEKGNADESRHYPVVTRYGMVVPEPVLRSDARSNSSRGTRLPGDAGQGATESREIRAMSPKEMQVDFTGASSRLQKALKHRDFDALGRESSAIRQKADTLQDHLSPNLSFSDRIQVPLITKMYQEGADMVEQGRVTKDETRINMGLQQIQQANDRLDHLGHAPSQGVPVQGMYPPVRR